MAAKTTKTKSTWAPAIPKKRIAQYIWVDGATPTHHLRSKAQIIGINEEPGLWGFDGSSTGQAEGMMSDCVLQPVLSVPDPIRGENNILVMCEVLNTDLTPHLTNYRARCATLAAKHAKHDMWFGLEQEYTLFRGRRPLGWPDSGFPAPQGGYYCGVGADEVFGRPLVNRHLEACLKANLNITGINAEVMPAQWEFQIGPVTAPLVADEIWLARWLLYRLGEDFQDKNGIGISATLDPKPVAGDWNGAGCHTNFSTKGMRKSYKSIEQAIDALSKRHAEHVKAYGVDVELRLTGEHETASFLDFSAGPSDRGASVRIPWQVEKARKGYIEDRRPNANCDPYVVTAMILETVCGALEGKTKS